MYQCQDLLLWLELAPSAVLNPTVRSLPPLLLVFRQRQCTIVMTPPEDVHPAAFNATVGVLHAVR